MNRGCIDRLMAGTAADAPSRHPRFGSSARSGRRLTWIELGPYRYLPTDPAVLQRELGDRGLSVAATFVTPTRAVTFPACRSEQVDRGVRVR